MNHEVLKKITDALFTYRIWRESQRFQSCRLVQYCGPDVSAIDIPAAEIEAQIEGLLAEGFYVDWACKADCLYLRVWEFGGAEPEWRFVYAETNLPEA